MLAAVMVDSTKQVPMRGAVGNAHWILKFYTAEYRSYILYTLRYKCDVGGGTGFVTMTSSVDVDGATVLVVHSD